MTSRAGWIFALVLALVLGVVPSTGLPQSPSDNLRGDDRERLAEAIRAAQAAEGADSTALIGPLTELSALYEAAGEHALAVAALRQAIDIVRATYGLHTLEQAPLLQQQLVNQQALGNFPMVEALEQELFDLAARYPDDLATVPIHRNIAARRMDLLQRFIAGEAPREIYGQGLYSFQRSELIQALVSEAQIHYADAAAVILRNGLYSSGELRNLGMEIILACDLFRQHFERSETEFSGAIKNMPREEHGVGRELDQWWNGTLESLRRRTNELWDLAAPQVSQRADGRRMRVDRMRTRYDLGRESYGLLIAYDDAVLRSSGDGTVWRRRLETHLQLADWDLLYSANGAALENYASVLELLESIANAQPLIATVFAPPIPIVLPTFLPNPLETPISARYIDVAFEITTYGKSRRIKILGTTPDVSDAEKNELVSLVTASRFRPRVADGELAKVSPVVLKYYLDD